MLVIPYRSAGGRRYAIREDSREYLMFSAGLRLKLFGPFLS